MFEDDEVFTATNTDDVASPRPAVVDDRYRSKSDSAAVVLDLIYAVENERYCPTILPYPTETVERISSLIIQQTAIADRLEAEEKEAIAMQGITLLPFQPSHIIRVEIQRVKFFLVELLRTRLRKIEALCITIVHEAEDGASGGMVPPLTPPVAFRDGGADSIRINLSPNELMLAEQLARIQQRCLHAGGLQFLPEPLQHLRPNLPHGEGDEILPRPNTSAYVFCTALTDLGSVQFDADVTQEVRTGEIFLAPYRTMSQLVLDGKARLV